ncbi:MAG: Gfo/Idh/MocA family protein [Promethearchaeia archaeon]
MKRKKTAVVGAGWFGRAHIRNFHELSELVAVCDLNEKNLELVKNQYNHINTYKDIKDMIKNEDLDAVSIVTPPKIIPKLAMPCAKAGIDILMEKPMALSLDELNSFRQFENIRIFPGFIELFNPVFDELLKHLPNIGNIISVASKRIGLYPRRNWHMGVVLDLSIHDIYLQRRLLGKDIIRAEGLTICIKDDRHADAAFIILDFGTTIGHIESNWLTPSKFRRMYVNGEEGGIMIDFITQKIDIRTGIELEGDHPVTKEIIYTPLKPDEPLRREIYNFLYDKDPLVSLDDGIKALEIALKIVNN